MSVLDARIAKLRDANHKLDLHRRSLSALLDHPEPGLLSWLEMVRLAVRKVEVMALELAAVLNGERD